MRYLLILIILSISNNLYAENKFDTFFSSTIDEKNIEIIGTKNENNRFEDNKILLIRDEKGKVLDSINIFYPDTNYKESILLSEHAFALRITIKEPYRNCFIYTNSTINSFCFYDCSKWVADGILLDDYILYSTEYDNNTIKRIDLKTNTIYSYKGYYPNVTLFECDEDEILGLFEYEGAWYEIYDDDIKKSQKQYNVTKKNIYDYFIY